MSANTLYLSHMKMIRCKTTSVVLNKYGGNSFYSQHHLVHTAFSNSERKFLFTADNEHLTGFLVLSKEPPTHSDIFKIQTTELNLPLTTGMRLKFQLRANPTICVNGTRHDVVSNAKRNNLEPRIELENWLKLRGEQWGVSFEEITASNHKIIRAKRKDKVISMARCDYAGTLTILDSERFLEQYAQGFGRGKAFGFGLMMIQPAERNQA